MGSSSSSGDEGMPVFLMAERQTSAGIVVATWPQAAPASAVNVSFPGQYRTRRSSSCPGRRKGGLAVGDRVDVKYEENWFAGSVHMILDDGAMYVQCDADEAGVLTLAQAATVRSLRPGR